MRRLTTLLRDVTRLTAAKRREVCQATCALDPVFAAGGRGGRRSGGGAAAAALERPIATAPSSAAGCLCGSAARRVGNLVVHSSSSVVPDCGCRGSAGAQTTLSMDATPMMHRPLLAAWRMAWMLPIAPHCASSSSFANLPSVPPRTLAC